MKGGKEGEKSEEGGIRAHLTSNEIMIIIKKTCRRVTSYQERESYQGYIHACVQYTTHKQTHKQQTKQTRTRIQELTQNTLLLSTRR